MSMPRVNHANAIGRPTVFYGVAGEGLGHAIRSAAVIERLRDIFEVHVFTSGDALNYYKKMNHAHLHEISGLHFGHLDGRISKRRTFLNGLRFLASAYKMDCLLVKFVEELKPVCVITDFEPHLPFVARLLSIPLVSIDNQHKFSDCKIAALPVNLLAYKKCTGAFIRAFIPQPDLTIISNFHYRLLKPKKAGTILTDVFLRDVFEHIAPSNGNFILVYSKKSINAPLLHSLALITDLRVKIYGASPPFVEGFEYCALSNEAFIEDLASCAAVICPAGNQLIGEALYFKKPVLAIPEPGQDEQTFNAWCIQKGGMGSVSTLEDLTPQRVFDFASQHIHNPSAAEKLENNALDVVTTALLTFIERPRLFPQTFGSRLSKRCQIIAIKQVYNINSAIYNITSAVRRIYGRLFSNA